MIGWCSGKLYTLQHISLRQRELNTQQIIAYIHHQRNRIIFRRTNQKKKVLDLLDLLQGNIWNELMFKDSR